MNSDSSWGGRPESPLDRAIDRAVRELMQVDPPAGLRRRVLSRLEPRVTWRPLFLPRYALAAAALTILVLSVMFMGRERGVPAGPDTASSTASGPPAQLQPAATPQPATNRAAAPGPATNRVTAGGVTREPIPMPRVASVFGAPAAGVSAAADPAAATVWTEERGGPESPANPVPPLVIAPLTPAAIETPAIVIPPLVIAGPPKGGL